VPPAIDPRQEGTTGVLEPEITRGAFDVSCIRLAFLAVAFFLGPDIARAQAALSPPPEVAAPGGAIIAPPETAAASPAGFELKLIGAGVYAAIRREPPGLMVDANSIFILNDDDVVVVDTNGTPSSAREVLAALRRLTTKPVRYVVNTHWHDDHIMGNQVWRDAYPGVEFIAHANTRAYLPEKGAAARRSMIEGAPPIVAMLRALVAKSTGLDGRPLTPSARASYLSDIRMAERYLAEVPGTEIVLPTITVDSRLTLYRGQRVIDIRDLGHGHTAGDLVVHLPAEGILIAGDLVVWPVPLVGSDQSHIADWIVTLGKLRDLHPVAIIPGHGPVLRDETYVALTQRLFASVLRQTRAAVARGESLQQTLKNIDLEEFRCAFAGDDQVRNVLFTQYVAEPATAAAFREAGAGAGS
jgi:cyclase